ncbi:MAG TPA: alcohol dehydrogenase [Thermoplasmatales archaeon]|nr:alcohol dehydrogenase [Thermoplasmatales archaeon]
MYYNNNDVRIEEQPIPEIQENEFLLKVMASGICGSDVMEWYRIKKAPRVLGHEVAGEIIKVGEKVKKFKVGDRVFVTHHVPCNTCRFCLNGKHTLCETLHSTNFYPGGFAEYIRVPSINVDRGTFLLPDEMSYEEGTFIEPLGCVVRGFRLADFTPAKTVLVIGSGIAGLLAIKLAKTLGASKIFATDINRFRLKMAEEMGADLSIHADENIHEKIREENEGRLPDFVILCTGALSAAKQSFQLVEPGGTLLLFAPTEPGREISIDLFDLWNKQVKIVSTYAAAGRDLLEAIELIKSKQVSVTDMITHRLPLEEAQRGFQLVAAADKSIKVIIQPHLP